MEKVATAPTLKYEHRAKALTAYQGARLTLSSDLGYPAYVLLKEATRALLCYIAEEVSEKQFHEKTKLGTVMEFIPDTVISEEDMKVLRRLCDYEQMDLFEILNIDLGELKEIKQVLKKLISTHLGEHL